MVVFKKMLCFFPVLQLSISENMKKNVLPSHQSVNSLWREDDDGRSLYVDGTFTHSDLESMGISELSSNACC